MTMLFRDSHRLFFQKLILTPMNTLLLRNNRFFYDSIEKTTTNFRLTRIKTLPLHHHIIFIGWKQKT